MIDEPVESASNPHPSDEMGMPCLRRMNITQTRSLASVNILLHQRNHVNQVDYRGRNFNQNANRSRVSMRRECVSEAKETDVPPAGMSRINRKWS